MADLPNSKIRSCQDIPSNQTPFFFYPTNGNWQLDPTKKIHVVRASDRQSEDPGSIPDGAALCFFRRVQLSVFICRIEKRKEFD